MAPPISLRTKVSGIVILSLLGAIAGVVVFSGSMNETAAGEGRKPTGYPQLISVQPLPEADGPMCQIVPARVGSSLVAALEQQRANREADAIGIARGKIAQRDPLRTIRDPYMSYSAVAVDPINNEVVMTDENLFSIVTYDRLENTPPKATMSEPQRIIRGMNAEIEFQCSLYVDPANGDIYAVNNDTLGKLVVFSRHAQGNVAPDRDLNVPQSFGIAVDDNSEELMLTDQKDAAVVTFRKFARGQDSPVRILQGVHTGLADPHGIAFDPKNDLIFVANWGSANVKTVPTSEPRTADLRNAGRQNWPIGGTYSVPGSGTLSPPSITVYRRNASGNMPPLRTIQGSQTQLNWPTGIAIDPERNELYVANDPTDTLAVFKADANGNVAPIRVVGGPKTLIKNPTGVHVDLKNDELWVANFGNHTATVYSRTASGDIPPLRVIRSAPLDEPAPIMGNPHVVTFDTRREEILVAN